MDAVQKANSGHPGMPMGMAPVAYLLFAEVMRHNPRDPHWQDRDRFVLSAGHGSMLLYAALHLSGYDVTLEDLKAFRQWESRTPGHPEVHHTPGVETTTGPLGQGFGNAVGMALAERFLRERFGAEVQDHRIFGICSDGDLMEGVSAEAASIAGHLGLGRLVFLYDDNHISIDGDTALSFDTEDVEARFARVRLAHAGGRGRERPRRAARGDRRRERGGGAPVADPRALDDRLRLAEQGRHGRRARRARSARTRCARRRRRSAGIPDKHFFVPDGVSEHFGTIERGAESRSASGSTASAPGRTRTRAGEGVGRRLGRPAAARARRRAADATRRQAARDARGQRRGAAGDRALPADDGRRLGRPQRVASRRASRRRTPTAASARRATSSGGSASTRWAPPSTAWCLHGGIVKPYGATFLQFADYMRPAIRLSALMNIPVMWVYSHDSVALGEDGPTHQPVEHLAALRAIPGLTVIRPSDANETAVAWRVMVEEIDGPCVLVLTPPEPAGARPRRLRRRRRSSCAALTCSSRTTTRPRRSSAPAPRSRWRCEARELLAGEGVAVRVVAMPSWELFAAQDDGLPRRRCCRPASRRSRSRPASRWAGRSGSTRSVSIERFGASAPGETVMRELGMTARAVADDGARAAVSRAVDAQCNVSPSREHLRRICRSVSRASRGAWRPGRGRGSA